MASRLGLLGLLGLLGDFSTGGSGSRTDFLSFDPPPRVQRGRHDHLRGDVGRRLMAGTRGVLMGSHHPTIDADRPVRTFGHIRVATQLIQDPGQGAVA